MNADGSMTGMPVNGFEGTNGGAPPGTAASMPDMGSTGFGTADTAAFDANYVAPVMPKGPDTKFDADYVAPVNGKGGDGKAGSNNAGEVKDVDGWDGIQRGGKKGPDTKFDADYVAPVMPKGPDTKFDADYVAPVTVPAADPTF